MALLTVNSHDYTKYILSGSWKVNRQDIYKSWTDANGITHHNVYRTKIDGECTMRFYSRSAYADFLNDMAAVKVSGYYPITVYVNNVLGVATINAFVTRLEPAMAAQYAVTPEFEQFTFKFEEA